MAVTLFRPLPTAGARRKVAPTPTHLFISVPISDPELRLFEQKIPRGRAATDNPCPDKHKKAQRGFDTRNIFCTTHDDKIRHGGGERHHYYTSSHHPPSQSPSWQTLLRLTCSAYDTCGYMMQLARLRLKDVILWRHFTPNETVSRTKRHNSSKFKRTIGYCTRTHCTTAPHCSLADSGKGNTNREECAMTQRVI